MYIIRVIGVRTSMKFNPQKYSRRSPRLAGYDYSLPGAYFITLVTHQREYLFGEVVNGEMKVNRPGKIVERAWKNLSLHYPQITLGAFVVMPNHVHGIVLINENDNSRGGSLWRGEPKVNQSINGGEISPDVKKTRPYTNINQTRSTKMMHHGLSEIVRAFKSFSARRINNLQNTHSAAIWQRSYYDHIIRSDQEFHNFCEYIQTNPQNWQEDQLHSSTIENK
jgi:putative transposase